MGCLGASLFAQNSCILAIQNYVNYVNRHSIAKPEVSVSAPYRMGAKVGIEPKACQGGTWYEDHLGPDTLQVRAGGTIRTMPFPVFSAEQCAVTRTVQ